MKETKRFVPPTSFLTSSTDSSSLWDKQWKRNMFRIFSFIRAQTPEFFPTIGLAPSVATETIRFLTKFSESPWFSKHHNKYENGKNGIRWCWCMLVLRFKSDTANVYPIADENKWSKPVKERVRNRGPLNGLPVPPTWPPWIFTFGVLWKTRYSLVDHKI